MGCEAAVAWRGAGQTAMRLGQSAVSTGAKSRARCLLIWVCRVTLVGQKRVNAWLRAHTNDFQDSSADEPDRQGVGTHKQHRARIKHCNMRRDALWLVVLLWGRSHNNLKYVFCVAGGAPFPIAPMCLECTDPLRRS